MLIQTLAEAHDSQGHQNNDKYPQNYQLTGKFLQACPTQNDTPDQPYEMCQGQGFRNNLSGPWHAGEWKHEAG